MESKKITKILCIIYLLFLTWIILFKMSTSLEELPHIRSINLVPFWESVIVNGRISFAEMLANVVAFVPFGIFTGILLEKSAFNTLGGIVGAGLLILLVSILVLGNL